MAGIWMACQWFWLPIVLGGLDRWGCWAAVGCLSCIILFLVRSMLLVGGLLELVSGLSGVLDSIGLWLWAEIAGCVVWGWKVGGIVVRVVGSCRCWGPAVALKLLLGAQPFLMIRL